MKRNIIISAAVGLLVIIALAGIGVGRKRVEAEVQTKPWIEVLSTSVWELDPATQEPLNDLVTGDELEPGTVIATNNAGFAIIHFPDGSKARLANNTELKIEQAEYNPETGSLLAKFKLESGAVWSKVFDLATPESAWQVETSTAVATVRGTAFDSRVINGQSWFIGAEHNVRLQPLAEDGQVMEAWVDLVPGKMMALNQSDIAKMAKDPEAMKQLLFDTPEHIRQGDWMSQNLGQDDAIDSLLNNFRERVGDNQEIRKVVARHWYDRFKDDIKRQRRLEKSRVYRYTVRMQEGLQNAASGVIPNRIPTPQPNDTTPPATDSPDQTSVKPTPQKVLIYPLSDTTDIPPGSQIRFKAVLIYSDKSNREITDEASWSVDKSLGRISSAGVIETPASSQEGSVSGTLTAIWTNPENGNQLRGYTTIQITFQNADPQYPSNYPLQ